MPEALAKVDYKAFLSLKHRSTGRGSWIWMQLPALRAKEWKNIRERPDLL